ncbi:prepilin-type N-terminal cleavage/methylation domain-containing protein [Metabacillus litoralis]|uniref:prepilin-type N-terminal cleavage/methylation domain-containing protein n=1 Tax=Metabacillus litoralis TaxID=152268 RepID=UPI00203B2390|nr:prepilin-type N-terminal cleavage/methylation domain-containing protein [Metabacillus litoralis]MCM3162953.1 prepilin-type N-terminal cleavage/methylation domain-containing protein [Metabacillus litoralis]
MLKKLMKNERGLTLIELLAVVVILGIIAAIAIPAIGALINNSKIDAHIANAKQIANAAKLQVNTGEVTTSSVTLEKLIEDNLIDPITDPSKKSVNYDEDATVVTFNDDRTEYYVKLVGENGTYTKSSAASKDASKLTRDDIDLNGVSSDPKTDPDTGTQK